MESLHELVAVKACGGVDFTFRGECGKRKVSVSISSRNLLSTERFWVERHVDRSSASSLKCRGMACMGVLFTGHSLSRSSMSFPPPLSNLQRRKIIFVTRGSPLPSPIVSLAGCLPRVPLHVSSPRMDQDRVAKLECHCTFVV